VVTTEDGGPVAQEGLVNVNVTDVVVQAPISVVANVCDVTVAVLVSRLQDGASPCDATGTAEAITATEPGPPVEAAPVDASAGPCPHTSPTRTAKRPSDSAIASRKSPPMCNRDSAGR
jgi:hypothetical protein